MEYYSKKYIQYLLLEGVRDREFAFLSKAGANIRALKVRCIFDFERALKLVDYEKNKPNIYKSVARLKNIPEFTFNPKKRSDETSEWFTNQFQKEVINYDLFFDFDKKENATLNDVLVEVKEFISYLRDYNVPFYIVFSGKKGFHVMIDGKYLDIERIENGNVYPHKKIAEQVKEVFNFRYLDLSNNGIANRLCKLPYSLVDENIALPLDDDQIDNFDVRNFTEFKITHSKIQLVRRGLIEREGTKDGLNNFIKSVSFN